MWNGVGGGTIVYAAQWQRNMPSDFRVRSLDGDRRRLAAHLRGPRALLRAGGEGLRRSPASPNDTAFPPGEGPPLPAVPLGPAGRKVARAHNELGWHWWPAPNAIATRKLRQPQPVRAARRVPEGVQGPREGHRSTSRTGRSRSAHGVELITKATVREITTGPDGLATGVDLRRRRGRRARAPRERRRSSPPTGSARRGCCLLSGGDRHPDGLANSSGMVGGG